MAEHARGAVLGRAIETCITPDDAAIAKLLDELFTDERPSAWSPKSYGRRARRPCGEAWRSESRRFPMSPSRSTRSTSSGTAV